LSQNRKCVCIIPECKHNREMFSDIVFLKRHLHTKHGHHELVAVAYEKGLIPCKKGYISHEWLVDEIAHICTMEEA